MLFDKKLYNIYLVAAIIGASLIFMLISTGVVMNNISDKTSADLAIERMHKACDKEKGKLVSVNPNNPLHTACE